MPLSRFLEKRTKLPILTWESGSNMLKRKIDSYIKHFMHEVVLLLVPEPIHSEVIDYQQILVNNALNV